MAMGTGKKKNRKIFIIVAVVVIVLLGAGAFLYAKTTGTKIDESKIAKVDQGDLAKSVVATGKITPITQIDIKSKASGIVKNLFVDAGDTVKTGQVLCELDKEEIQASLAQSRASLEAAEANLRGTQADIERAKYDAQGPDIPTLQRAYERAQHMAKEGVVSQSALDDAQRAYELAVNKRDSGQANLIVARAKQAQAKAQVAQQKATVDQIDTQYKNSTLLAPIGGIILSRDVEKGAAVSSILILGSGATLVMTMGDTHEVYVKGKVDESDIGKVFLGQPARIKVESFKDKT